MRRRELSNEELDKVIKLRQAGASWLKIQHETRIHRRTVKRAYDQWERSKSVEELKEARKDVAIQEFRRHMNSLVTLSTSFVIKLEVPHLPNLMDKDTEQFVSSLFEGDLLLRGTYISAETNEAYASPWPIVNPQAYRRENELLFESLQVHTREKVQWKAWDEWKEARDNCKRVLDKLAKKSSEEVGNFLHQERGLLRSIKEGSREDDPVKRIGEAVLRETWGVIFRDKLDEEDPLFQTVSRGEGTAQEISVKGRGGTVLYFNYAASPDKRLAEKVTGICNLVVNNLRKGDMVQQLQQEVHRMKKASDELCEALNPVKLRPMILRTRCDLCPA